MSLRRRVPSLFCCSSSSSTWRLLSRPSSTSASAIRSPKGFIGGIRSTESFAEVLDEFSRGDQIPQQTVTGGARQFFGRLSIEGIGGRDENGFAHAIEGQDAPTLANRSGKAARQVHVNIVIVEGQKGGARFIRYDLQ